MKFEFDAGTHIWYLKTPNGYYQLRVLFGYSGYARLIEAMGIR